MVVEEIEVSSNSKSRSGSRANTDRDRIRCYTCREYDHFMRDCPSSREERDLEQLQQMLNMEEQTHRQESPKENYRSPLNFMISRDDTTTFLPLDSEIGGQSRDSCPTVGQYLTRNQIKYIYKKVKNGEMIYTDTIQQEIEQEKQLGRIDDTSRETNPYKELIVNTTEKIEPLTTQMEQWSILSNILNYVQHSRFKSINRTLEVKAVNKVKSKPNVDR